MACVSIRSSLFERAFGELIGRLAKERLILDVSSSQRIEADAAMLQLDFSAYKPMRPVETHIKGSAEQGHASLVIGASQIDQRSSQNVLQVQGPRLWKRSSWWGRVDACDSPATYGRHVLVRLRKQLPPRLETEAVLNLGLPASIVALDGSLKSRFSRRCEHHRDSQAKAQSRYSPHSLRMSVRSLRKTVSLSNWA